MTTHDFRYTLLNPALSEEYIAKLKAEQAAMRESHASRTSEKTYVSLETARANRLSAE